MKKLKFLRCRKLANPRSRFWNIHAAQGMGSWWERERERKPEREREREKERESMCVCMCV